MLRLLLLLLRLLLLLLLLLPLLLLLLLLFLTEFVVASFGVKSKLTPSFFSNPLPPSLPPKQTLFLDPPPSLTLSCSSHTPSYTSHTMPAASCQGDPHSKDPFSAAAAAAAAAARKEPPRKKKKNKFVTLKMKQKISNTKIRVEET